MSSKHDSWIRRILPANRLVFFSPGIPLYRRLDRPSVWANVEHFTYLHRTVSLHAIARLSSSSFLPRFSSGVFVCSKRAPGYLSHLCFRLRMCLAKLIRSTITDCALKDILRYTKDTEDILKITFLSLPRAVESDVKHTTKQR